VSCDLRMVAVVAAMQWSLSTSRCLFMAHVLCIGPSTHRADAVFIGNSFCSCSGTQRWQRACTVFINNVRTGTRRRVVFVYNLLR